VAIAYYKPGRETPQYAYTTADQTYLELHGWKRRPSIAALLQPKPQEKPRRGRPRKLEIA